MLQIAACPAAASVTKGPYTFDENAFADDAIVVHANVGYVNAASLHDALAGADLTSWATLDVNGIMAVGFEGDHHVVNGPGADLVVFDEGAPDSFSLAVYTTYPSQYTSYISYMPVAIVGQVDGYSMNAAEIDLNDFGVAADAEIQWMLVKGSINTAEIAGIGALNFSPEPATLVLLGLGAGALLARRRRAVR
jgi:hypothetical protein